MNVRAALASSVAAVALITACSSSKTPTPESPRRFAVGGTVSGLTGSLVLQKNGGDDVTLDADGAFTFATGLVDGAGYEVTVKTQPASQRCTISGGLGMIRGADARGIAVTCVPLYTVGGAVSGLSGTLLLQNNGADDLTLTVNGSFSFSTLAEEGAAYDVTIKTQPAGQDCTVSSASGTLGRGPVTTVAVSCASRYAVGGTIWGLKGTLVLQNNGGSDLAVNADGAFAFPVQPDGSAYDVTVKTQPAGQVCAVSAHSGVIGGADVHGVSVSCVSYWSVGGTISGLRGTLVLQNDGPDYLVATNDRAFSFPARIPEGTIYRVTIKSQPAGQTCAVTGGAGVASGADVGNVSVTCGEPMVVGPFTAAYYEGPTLVTTATVARPALRASGSFPDTARQAYNFHGVWTGDLEVRGPATAVDFSLDISWANVGLYVDAATVASTAMTTTVRRVLDPGVHHVTLDYENNWHTISFFSGITTHTPLTKTEAQKVLATLVDANTRIVYVGCYESADTYMNTTLTLGASASKVFLVLGSFRGMSWTILNPNNVNVVGIAYGSPVFRAGTVTADSIPIVEIAGLSAAYDAGTLSTARADVASIVGRPPDAASSTYAQGDMTITPP